MPLAKGSSPGSFQSGVLCSLSFKSPYFCFAVAAAVPDRNSRAASRLISPCCRHTTKASTPAESVRPARRISFARDMDGNLIELIDLGYMHYVVQWLGPLGGWLFRRGMYRHYYEVPAR